MAKISEESIAYSTAALQRGDVKEAIAIRNLEFGQESGSFDDYMVRTMNFILGRTPALLSDCPPEFLDPLRIAAAMMELWGEAGIKRFVTIEGEWSYRFGPDTIAYMMRSHACFLRSLEDIRQVGISNVRLISGRGDDDCEACRAVDDKPFTVDTVPEIPLVTCTCSDKFGCRVIVTADPNPTRKRKSRRR